MPSFLDELKSKQETVIKAETAANNEVEKLMQIKPAVIDRVMQIEAKRTVGRIKNDIAKEIEKNPRAKYYVVRYFGDSFVDHLHIFDLIKVFSEFGYNFDSKSLESALWKMGLSGVRYDDDNPYYPYYAYRSIVKLHYETNGFWRGRRNVVNKEGKRFIKLLSDAAAAEGIKITYRDIFENYNKSHFMGLSKESKKEEYLDECSFVTASVRI